MDRLSCIARSALQCIAVDMFGCIAVSGGHCSEYSAVHCSGKVELHSMRIPVRGDGTVEAARGSQGHRFMSNDDEHPRPS